MLNNPVQAINYEPADHGLTSWTFDPTLSSGTLIMPAAGTLNTARLKLRGPTLVSGIVMLMSVAGATLTSGQNFAMVFDEAGNRVGLTADQTSAWTSGLGVLDMPLAVPTVLNGPFCTVGFYANGSTLPTWRLGSASTANGNANLATAASRFGTANTGLTSTPPATLGTITARSYPWWVGLR